MDVDEGGLLDLPQAQSETTKSLPDATAYDNAPVTTYFGAGACCAGVAGAAASGPVELAGTLSEPASSPTMEPEPLPPREAITDSVIDVIMKMMADQVVALDSARGGAPWAKCGLAAHPAKSGRDITALAALQQHHDDQKKTNNDVNGRNQNKSCIAKPNPVSKPAFAQGE